MIIQYLIDWENLIPDEGGNCSERLCEQLLHLMCAVRRNGVLVNSTYVERLILQRKSADNSRLIDRVLDEVIASYRDFGERVDTVDDPAANLNETINRWQEYLMATGVEFGRRDFRCVVVGAAGHLDCGFYCCKSLEEALEIGGHWARLLHFNRGPVLDFRKYIEAFSASAENHVRIYDPYLSSAFKSVERASSVKAWRNSLYFLLGIVLKNNHITMLDIITTDNISSYFFSEVVEDIITPLSRSRHDQNIADLSFHFVNSERSFHDRFLSNGRFCFAIGHGCDVCEADRDYQNLEKQARAGEQIWIRQWRNMPRLGTEELSGFNVYYGCSKNNVPRGVPVFMERNANEQGESIIYPSGCWARRLEDIRTGVGDNGEVQNRFLGIPGNQRNPVVANDRIRVFVNPLTCDDF